MLEKLVNAIDLIKEEPTLVPARKILEEQLGQEVYKYIEMGSSEWGSFIMEVL